MKHVKKTLKSLTEISYGAILASPLPELNPSMNQAPRPEENSMPGKERRIFPRKPCTIPVRFRSIANEYVPVSMGVAAARGSAKEIRTMRPRPSNQETIVGESVNLSELGIGFKSPFRFSVGEAVEIYFTLPRELTGRNPEEVRCNARVVHVEKEFDAQGMTGVGATVERFEPLDNGRKWEN